MNQEHLDNEIYKQLLRVCFDNSKDGIFLLCDAMRFSAVNHRIEEWLGVEQHSLTMEDERALITEFIQIQDAKANFQEHLRLALEGKPQQFQCEIHPKKASSRWLDISLNRILLDDVNFVMGIARDISDHKHLLDALKHQSTHDQLTGLPNRNQFTQHLEDLLNDAHSYDRTHTLIYLDLDHFKVINDTTSHSVGDQCLVHVANLLQEEIGYSGLLARIGGDEFGVLLEAYNTEEAKPMAERILAHLRKHPFKYQDRSFVITASIGYVAINKQHGDVSELFSAADAACYVAKDMGRNQLMEYYGGVRCSSKREEMNWVTRIHEALEQNQFELFYQEIQPFSNTNNVHCEVLIRLRDADGNIIAPGEFLPAAERYNLMPRIDRWVLENLFNRCFKQHLCNNNIIWSVNLSGASVGNKEFLSFLFRMLADSDVNPEKLCFEITETMAIANLGHALEFMQRVRSLGSKIALDDFGSGMSSFSYLKTLPADYVKLDGSLIVNLDDNTIDRSIVESVNHISHNLGLLTIAEFVENQTIVDILEKIGVDFLQGYHIHRPAPLKELTAERAAALSATGQNLNA